MARCPSKSPRQLIDRLETSAMESIALPISYLFHATDCIVCTKDLLLILDQSSSIFGIWQKQYF